MNKPKVKLTGKDGNIFNLMGIASKEMKRLGLESEARGMLEKIHKNASSYDEALQIIMEYCDVS